jgi:hypothetical protein
MILTMRLLDSTSVFFSGSLYCHLPVLPPTWIRILQLRQNQELFTALSMLLLQQSVNSLEFPSQSLRWDLFVLLLQKQKARAALSMRHVLESRVFNVLAMSQVSTLWNLSTSSTEDSLKIACSSTCGLHYRTQRRGNFLFSYTYRVEVSPLEERTRGTRYQTSGSKELKAILLS